MFIFEMTIVSCRGYKDVPLERFRLKNEHDLIRAVVCSGTYIIGSRYSIL